jgi:hypothetical protein
MVLLQKAARARSEPSRRQVELAPTTGRGGRLHPQSGTSDLPVPFAMSIQRSIATPINRRRLAAEHRAYGQEGATRSTSYARDREGCLTSLPVTARHFLNRSSEITYLPRADLLDQQKPDTPPNGNLDL